ncbi:MAG: HNH endonuclease [Agathobacter sp.]|nr:HNH endonuclease [Agathobacter sp.]
MDKLYNFSIWMNEHSALSQSSIYKYTRAVNTISNEMLHEHVIYKSLLKMNRIELDLAIINILQNERFITKNSVGNNMYSNALKQFRYFTLDSDEDTSEEQEIVHEITQEQFLTETEKETIIKARVGQGKYRKQLLDKYDNKCIITGISQNKLLIASHIKPWAICNNDERIDVENGLILCANMDRLFDSGLITFRADGKMFVSSFVSEDNKNRLNISNDIVVDLHASDRLLDYLEYHRDVLYVK